MINLNKIDSQIVKIIVEKTSKSEVHKKENAFVDEDGKHRQENKNKFCEIEKKVKIINKIFNENEIEIYLVLSNQSLDVNIKVMALEKATDRVLLLLDENEINEILKKIHSNSGIIFDMKG